VAKDMSKAYNELHVFSEKSAKHFSKKISKLSNDDIAKGEKLAKQYVSLLVSNKAERSRSLFFGNLLKEGFEGMSDANDRDGMMQDPLIIFNPSKVLGKVQSVKLTSKDLDNYWKMTNEKEFTDTRKDLSKIQR
jgi:hypothetical protein